MAPPGWKDAIGTDARFEGAIFYVKRGGRVTMGVWGTGLYSGDFARDLRAAVAAVARLPFDPDKLVDILCTTEPSAANDPGGEDHTTFWLVVADQFAKIGIDCDRVRNKALSIIDGGDDIAAHELLGMTAPDLRKRRKVLDEIRARIVTPPAARERTVLRKPQPLLMQVGDVMVYPTCRGKGINPYYPSNSKAQQKWTQDGWGAMVIVDCGRAFDFLSWYRPLTIAEPRAEKPSIDSLRGQVPWTRESAGTCSSSHFKKMELEKVGALSIDPEKLKHVLPDLRPGTSAAIQDISIANRMFVRRWAIPRPGENRPGFAPMILGIEQILHE